MHSSSPRLLILLGVLSTLFCVLIYVTLEQAYRGAGFEPQIQIAEDGAASFANGLDPNAIAPRERIDLRAGLGTFWILYDASGTAALGSGVLNSALPRPPQGVFDTAKIRGENRLAWEPKPGVRIAIVMNYFQGKRTGYLLVGRSLRETEARKKRLLETVLAAWAGAIGLIMIAWFVGRRTQNPVG